MNRTPNKRMTIQEMGRDKMRIKHLDEMLNIAKQLLSAEIVSVAELQSFFAVTLPMAENHILEQQAIRQDLETATRKNTQWSYRNAIRRVPVEKGGNKFKWALLGQEKDR